MKLEELTPDQEKLMDHVSQEWLDYLFSCKNSLNENQAEEQIKWFYNFCELDEPIIIFVDSPLECQQAVWYVKAFSEVIDEELIHSSSVRAKVWAKVGDKVWAKVRDNYESFCLYGSIADFGWISFYDFWQKVGIIEENDFNFGDFKKLIQSGVYDI